jgi:hypothetical protein
VNTNKKFNLSGKTAKGVVFLAVALQFIKKENVNMALRKAFGPRG